MNPVLLSMTGIALTKVRLEFELFPEHTGLTSAAQSSTNPSA